MDFWPFYCGAVDVGKGGLSSNPKAQRRHDKIWALAKSFYTENDRWAGLAVESFDLYFQDLQKEMKDKAWENNEGNVQRWPSERCNGAQYQLAKMTLDEILTAIKRADLNEIAKKHIIRWKILWDKK